MTAAEDPAPAAPAAAEAAGPQARTELAESEQAQADLAGVEPAQPELAEARQAQPDRAEGGPACFGDELQKFSGRWHEIQAAFVDDPRTAVQDADALVAEFLQRLAATFAQERADLEQRWATGNDVSTEDLRQSLRRYRAFFERLHAAGTPG